MALRPLAKKVKKKAARSNPAGGFHLSFSRTRKSRGPLRQNPAQCRVLVFRARCAKVCSDLSQRSQILRPVCQGPDRRAQQLLLMPETFMNRSGQSVAAATKFYKLPPQDVLVIHDELDLPPGQMKLKPAEDTADTTVYAISTAILAIPTTTACGLVLGTPAMPNKWPTTCSKRPEQMTARPLTAPLMSLSMPFHLF